MNSGTVEDLNCIKMVASIWGNLSITKEKAKGFTPGEMGICTMVSGSEV